MGWGGNVGVRGDGQRKGVCEPKSWVLSRMYLRAIG